MPPAGRRDRWRQKGSTRPNPGEWRGRRRSPGPARQWCREGSPARQVPCIDRPCGRPTRRYGWAGVAKPHSTCDACDQFGAVAVLDQLQHAGSDLLHRCVGVGTECGPGIASAGRDVRAGSLGSGRPEVFSGGRLRRRPWRDGQDTPRPSAGRGFLRLAERARTSHSPKPESFQRPPTRADDSTNHPGGIHKRPPGGIP